MTLIRSIMEEPNSGFDVENLAQTKDPQAQSFVPLSLQ